MRPDIDKMREHYCQGAYIASGHPGVIMKLLAYIDELERDLLNERATFESCNRARQHCEHECATLKARTTYTVGETEWAHRIATLEHMLAEERENVDTLRARVAELEAEVATLRHRDALLKRVHGALADMCCRVPTSIDEPVDHIVRLSLSRANQRFVDEYDLRVSAQDWANDLRAELFDWQHAVEYVLGDNWCSADGHDAKAARKALAEWAAKAQGEAPQLLLDERDAALREVAGAKLALADYDRACVQVSSLTVENAELKARIAVLEAMKP